jgi:hypothetical protein
VQRQLLPTLPQGSNEGGSDHLKIKPKGARSFRNQTEDDAARYSLCLPKPPVRNLVVPQKLTYISCMVKT